MMQANSSELGLSERNTHLFTSDVDETLEERFLYPDVYQYNCMVEQVEYGPHNRHDNDKFMKKLKRLNKLQKKSIIEEQKRGWENCNAVLTKIPSQCIVTKTQIANSIAADDKWNVMYDQWKRSKRTDILAAKIISDRFANCKEQVRRMISNQASKNRSKSQNGQNPAKLFSDNKEFPQFRESGKSEDMYRIQDSKTKLQFLPCLFHRDALTRSKKNAEKNNVHCFHH